MNFKCIQTVWYLVQDRKITALRIMNKNIQHIDLSYFQELQELYLIHCNISNLSLSKLPPKLTKLDLSRNENLTQVDLSGLQELQELDLRECNIQEIKIPQELRGKIRIIGFDENKIEWV